MRFGSALIAAAASAAAMGCGFNQEGIPPARDQIFYPGGMEVDPGGRWLYVVNSNADLRFNDGTLAVVDLQEAGKTLAGARPSLDPTSGDRLPAARPRNVCDAIGFFNPLSGPRDLCCWDALDHNVLNCDERQFVKADATVKIGSFGSAIQVLPTPKKDGSRLLVAVRGNSSITWITARTPDTDTPPALSCTKVPPGAGVLAECDEAHRVTSLTDPPGLTSKEAPVALPEEPYALALDDQQQLLYIGHLRGGFLSAVDLSIPNDYGVDDLEGHPAQLIGTFPSIFGADINGSAGVTSLTVTAKGINSGRVYATSRFVPRAGAFAPVSLGVPMGQPSADNRDTFLANAGDAFVSPLPGAEVRGIQVIPGIARTFLLQRSPPALVAFSTLDFQNTPSDVIEMCTGPTFLHMHSPTGSQDDMQLFVTCFESGQVYVVDPYVPKIITIIEVGRGPSGLAFSPTDHTIAYVVGFGSNNVSVIDLAPGSDTRYHVVERIGFPDPVPR